MDGVSRFSNARNKSLGDGIDDAKVMGMKSATESFLV